MLFIKPCPPHQGKGKRSKRETDLQIGNQNCFTNNPNNNRNDAKYTKPMLSFQKLRAVGAGVVPVVAAQTPESPGLHFILDGNCIQECTDWNLDQDRR